MCLPAHFREDRIPILHQAIRLLDFGSLAKGDLPLRPSLEAHEGAVRGGLMLDRRDFLRLGFSLFPKAMPRATSIVTRSTPKDQIDVVHTRVFAAGPGGGNRCPVIPDADRLTDADMQVLARQFGLDTAFILRSEQ